MVDLRLKCNLITSDLELEFSKPTHGATFRLSLNASVEAGHQCRLAQDCSGSGCSPQLEHSPNYLRMCHALVLQFHWIWNLLCSFFLLLPCLALKYGVVRCHWTSYDKMFLLLHNWTSPRTTDSSHLWVFLSFSANIVETYILLCRRNWTYLHIHLRTIVRWDHNYICL